MGWATLFTNCIQIEISSQVNQTLSTENHFRIMCLIQILIIGQKQEK